MDIATAQILNYLFGTMRSSNASAMSLCLDTVYSLLSHTPIVKEALAKGGKYAIYIRIVLILITT